MQIRIHIVLFLIHARSLAGGSPQVYRPSEYLCPEAMKDFQVISAL